MREAVPQYTRQYQTTANQFVESCVGRLALGWFDQWPKSPVESPLEDAFLKCWCIVDWIATMEGQQSLAICPQVTTRTGFRLDFVVFDVEHEAATRVGVELDGHDFHEKTKEQVARRNERDRQLAAEGWQVLRFSGSEFYGDPFKCVREARALVKQRRPVVREAADV